MRLIFSRAPEVAAPLQDVWPRILHPRFLRGPGRFTVKTRGKAPGSAPEVNASLPLEFCTGFAAGLATARSSAEAGAPPPPPSPA
jgi:hypothetical protein